jgi:hypothetical protein
MSMYYRRMSYATVVTKQYIIVHSVWSYELHLWHGTWLVAEWKLFSLI